MARYDLARRLGQSSPWLLAALALVGALLMVALGRGGPPPAPMAGAPYDPYPTPPEMKHLDLLHQTAEQAAAKSAGCVACHQGSRDPHYKDSLHIGCADCHGGDPTCADKAKAHVAPRFPDVWRTSANPQRSYTVLNHESPEFVRFVNPGDLRIAHISCGLSGCHTQEVLQNKKSMMTHGCMLWGAALYNNGGIPFKRSRYGESYSMHGVPQRLQTVPPPTAEEMRKGVVPFLDPLPKFEITQPGNILRIFERGGKLRPEVGLPLKEEDPGRPFLTRLSTRGLGTENRTDPVFIGLAKTRLLDPTLNFLGTNDHPGDYRSSGCSSCHVIYANDRSAVNSGPYAWAGNRGTSHTVDPTIPKNESGHPIAHRFTTAIPSSQCIVCHIHPGTTVMNSYLGFMWWDVETDGHLIWPKKSRYPSAVEFTRAQMSNPNEIDARNRLAEPEFLANLIDQNPKTKHTQFGDFHGHGWAFRAVFKHNRKGEFLDAHGNPIGFEVEAEKRMAAMEFPAKEKLRYKSDPPAAETDRNGMPVHMLDIHLEKGMHCVDCHFVQDNHGNTKLQMEVRAAIEIQCIDCHGTVTKQATLRTTGPASYTSSPEGGRNLEALRTPFGKRRFERKGSKIIQNSMVEKGLSWEVKQTKDTVDPASPHYNERAALAKTVRFDEHGKFAWGDVPGGDERKLAHCNSNMSCIACHSSWNPSCYGCHLPQKANKKVPELHNRGDVSRNYVSYNFQTLRDEVFMLARDGDATGNRIGPSRSSCAIHVGSYNGNRESIYVQQQTISGEGMSGIAFSTNVPHTVRGRSGNPLLQGGVTETKGCTDCHVSSKGENNAIMAQLLMQGTNYLNFIGRYAWVAAGEHGFFAVEVTERDEPQAVFGSSLHEMAFSDRYEEFVKHGRKIEVAHEHPGKDISEQLLHPRQKFEIRNVQNRGEYLYAACGEGGLKVFDISMIDHKGFSERTFTAPVSPIGQRFYVKTKCAMYVASPTTIAPDPTRTHCEENREQPVAGPYAYLYVADKYEGLILVGAGTLLDGDPTNNFLKRETTFNPDGLLNGANFVQVVGNYAYVCCDAGLVVVSLADPKKLEVKCVLGHEVLKHPHCVQIQFRYAFVCDEEGLKVLDVTDLEKPHGPVGHLHLEEAHSVYVARTYAYVAGGKKGLIIVDVENPHAPKIDQIYDAGGCMNDVHDVKLAITYVSQFAYVADGKNGLRVLQLTSPETPGNMGFSPRPEPKLIGTHKFPKDGHALAVAEGVDRDRAVDESGNQIAVFGRVGGRPLNLKEQQKMYLKDGRVWTVTEDVKDPMYQQGKRR